MTQEEKAKAYDEAIERAKELLEIGVKDTRDKRVVLSFFPELKESEDERIRKEIIRLVKETKVTDRYYELNKMLAWLEKQGEQKPADKVEPKFKVGDWVVYDKYDEKDIDKIVKIDNDKVSYESGEWLYIHQLNEDCKLWTIQDAKDGDVLCTYECEEPKIVFILKGTPKKHYALSYYCYYNIMYPHFDDGNKQGCLAPEDSDVKPATKEQREQLEKAMTDAGYTFDFEKKELKKIEQKPAWSEEDEKMIEAIEALCDDKIRFTEFHDVKEHAYTVKNWLKSLKDRVQPVQEWSEEDKEMYKEVLTDIIYAKNDLKAKECHGLSKRAIEAFNWFSNRYKSLIPQSQWKPSDEQMDALRYVTNFDYGGHKTTLVSLYEQLKKLKG